jgi:hypothetical protein
MIVKQKYLGLHRLYLELLKEAQFRIDLNRNYSMDRHAYVRQENLDGRPSGRTATDVGRRGYW